MKDFSAVMNAHPSYLENLYQSYLENPASVDESWKAFFMGFDLARSNSSSENGHKEVSTIQFSSKELSVAALIDAYRHRGHLLSDTNPIRKRRDRKPHLQLQDFGLTEQDLSQKFQAGELIGKAQSSLKEILDHLQKIYCQTIGFEYSHIEDNEKRHWLRDKIEKNFQQRKFDIAKKKRILEKLNDAVIFEKFLHTKYVGQKRFSLEGGESTIAALDAIINLGSEHQVEECVIGMAHRGRLNVLANIMGKTYEQIFNEFEGNAVPELSFGSGDVKYHLGYASQVATRSGKNVHLKLAPNPSHLEAVDPVVEGLARAKADILYKSDYDKILPILIHGDAAVVGQGVVYEVVQMSQLKGYYTGGTFHFVINNQIGFTTDFDDARSSNYCTAAASAIQAPVFHVNGDDPEAVVYAVELALEYRQHFNSDVFVDMVCYRRHGHNEGDDPKFTQPEMYDIISSHPNVREIYIKTLTDRGDVDQSLAAEMEKSFWNVLQERLDLVKQKTLAYTYQEPELAWKTLKKVVTKEDFVSSPKTGISIEEIKNLIENITAVPPDFHVLPKVNRLLKSWNDLIQNKQMDWALAELLAYASILKEGKNVRMSGQDVKRGTFSHRHAVLFDEKNNQEYNRLSKLSENQGQFFIYNSLLSEFAVLGFEYGYSIATPNHLVIWEAQFGDFANGAQVIFDQFFTAAESKWNRMSGIVMLLPHGYDGQGPEHSSARLERYLQACAEKNIVIANVTTPANFFHIIRRQLAWNFRKPLIIMSPKSLLRHPKCISPIDQFTTDNSFQEILINASDEKKSNRILFCSGQVYYDLLQRREDQKIVDCTIVRLEQLYPFPEDQIAEIIKKNPKAKKAWVQEEPLNMGAAGYIKARWNYDPLTFVTRPASASPAVGFKKVHDKQLIELMDKAFGF